MIIYGRRKFLRSNNEEEKVMTKQISIILIIAVVVFISIGCSKNKIIKQNEQTHKEAVLELMSLMNMENLINETIDTHLDIQIQQNPSLAYYKGTIKEFLNKYISWESLQDEYFKIYQEEFSENEIRDMIKFYKTETGKKTLERLPVLMQKGAKLGQQRVQENIHELQEMLKAKQSELNDFSEE